MYFSLSEFYLNTREPQRPSGMARDIRSRGILPRNFVPDIQGNNFEHGPTQFRNQGNQHREGNLLPAISFSPDPPLPEISTLQAP